MRLVAPGADQFITEKYADEIGIILNRWASALKQHDFGFELLRAISDSALTGSFLLTGQERLLRDRYGISVTRKQFSSEPALSREQFLEELSKYLEAMPRITTAEFQVTGIRQLAPSLPRISAEVRYLFIGEGTTGAREQRLGTWQTEWHHVGDGAWKIATWLATEETISRSTLPLFADITGQAFGGIDSYREQLLSGTDHWRTVLDGASGIDVYGNHGIAVGDFDADGFEDVYICQPPGLPNRLYRNRGDGTFEDVTEQTGLGVLDASSCALFADFENRGQQDLLVVTSSGPLLFINNGEGHFSLKQEAFRFDRPPQGAFTHAALADYDHDGRLDVYFCLYNYYAGLDQYRYPSPYFDARNGPPNFLLHNDGDWTFSDKTEAAGLNVHNDRYSFACAWGDQNGNGWPDLYVANDFGRSNLYRNNGDGTFTSLSTEANVEDVGAGMSACWLDFDGNGQHDIYVANMWSAAGLRVSTQEIFHGSDPENVRGLYRRHARGNSLYRNLGNGIFRNVAAENGTEYGGWAWSSDSWDFDHDGHPDIYIANGYVSGDAGSDLSSFFWRQVVGNSPVKLSSAPKYEQGWNAINELIRSDKSWSGYERNVHYANNGDGTFSDVSGITSLAFPDDSRAFSLADIDHDGRLEVLLKNRTAPQVRVLRNVMPEIGNSISFRLRGTTSNRDAIGAAITIDAGGRSQTKFVQAGSGFLSQHTKEIFFGVGEFSGTVKATIRWPRGAPLTLKDLPLKARIEIVEGSSEWHSVPHVTPNLNLTSGISVTAEEVSKSVSTWLIQPLPAPAFSLLDNSGKVWDLHSIQGNKLLTFWTAASPDSHSQLRSLSKTQVAGLQILAINVASMPFPEAEKLSFPILSANDEVTGTYNVIFRYLFDRHRDLPLPTSFLLDADGMIVKVFQGEVNTDALVSAVKTIPTTSKQRVKLALPFAGTLHLGKFQRNDFTYGVAFFQHGYLDAAVESFKQVIASKPDEAEAHYNLGTLYLRQKDFSLAKASLERALRLKPVHPEAWNNLGMVAAEEGHTGEAIEDFTKSLSLRPDFVVALLNLGNLYRRQKRFPEAAEMLSRAYTADQANPEVNYSLGMLSAQQNDDQKAKQAFERALKAQPDYADALNNYGVLLVREQQYSQAEDKFQQCIRSNPKYDQAYLNLARLYALLLNDRDKARTVLQELLTLQPQHVIAQQALKMLQ
jgi:Flp pilus assembly protein TadD/peroxiredoxin